MKLNYHLTPSQFQQEHSLSLSKFTILDIAIQDSKVIFTVKAHTWHNYMPLVNYILKHEDPDMDFWHSQIGSHTYRITFDFRDTSQ